MRRNFSKAVKLAAWERSGGRCEECTAPLSAGNIEYDHRIPDAFGGEPTLENCVVLCKSCHRSKTSKADQPNIARAKRRQAKHIGAKPKPRRSFATNRDGPFKRRLDGTTVRREP